MESDYNATNSRIQVDDDDDDKDNDGDNDNGDDNDNNDGEDEGQKQEKLNKPAQFKVTDVAGVMSEPNIIMQIDLE